MRNIKYLLLLFGLMAGSFPAWSQGGGGRQMEEEPPYQPPKNIKTSFFRKALSQVNIGLSTGYGYTLYQQDLSGYSLFRQKNEYFLVPENEINFGRVNRSFTQWLNDPQDRSNVIPTEQDMTLIGNDTTHLDLSGAGQSLPLNLSLHFNLFDRLKMGGGVSAELFSIRDLKFDGWNEVPAPYRSNVNSALMLRYYGSLGARVSRWYFWDFTVDAQIGKKKFISQFNQDLISDGLYYNAGLLIERHFSEYFRFTLRPSVEWSSYDMNLPATEKYVTTQTPAFYIQAGINFNFPRLPRCPINPCHAQLEHVHSGKEYRGQPFYRWQNPKYGQNHPELMRNKKRKKDDTEQRTSYKKKRKKRFFLW